mgnify:CR=1 FL=1
MKLFHQNVAGCTLNAALAFLMIGQQDAVGLLLFGGRGKISELMGDFAKGIKAFKSGMKEPDEENATATRRRADGRAPPPARCPGGLAPHSHGCGHLFVYAARIPRTLAPSPR